MMILWAVLIISIAFVGMVGLIVYGQVSSQKDFNEKAVELARLPVMTGYMLSTGKLPSHLEGSIMGDASPEELQKVENNGGFTPKRIPSHVSPRD